MRVDIAINHNHEALQMHAANHPWAEHLCEDVWNVDPATACRGRPIRLAWFSPDCKHFSKAKGGKPVDKKIRGLAWVAVKWADLPEWQRPQVIMLENVEEFRDWGPIDPETNMPLKDKLGVTYARFKRALKKRGYEIEDRELLAADYGTPQKRKRLFMIARRDGLPIVWPKPTHAPDGKGGLVPWRTAGNDVIDFSIPTRSIFGRKKNLAENTQRRIARGIDKFVINNPKPFIVSVAHGSHKARAGSRVHGLDEPMRTVNASGGEYALVNPHVVRIGHTGHGDSGKVKSIDEPLSTITSKNEHLLIAPYFVPRYGERPGQEPRCATVEAPLPTTVPTQNGATLVAAFLAKHNGGNEATGQNLDRPVDTVTSVDSKAVVASTLVKLKGTSRHGQSVDEPLHTVAAGGNHFAEVRAFLIKFYSEGGQWASCHDPMHTIPCVDRMGLVTVYDELYQMVDIHMRMLTPRELFRAQGFSESYVIDRRVDGTKLTARQSVNMCGNSVPPQLAQVLVEANVCAYSEGIVVDNFAGGGGASTGIEAARLSDLRVDQLAMAGDD